MSRLRLVDNAATVISEGAAWIAHDGVGLQLAKPIELLHADDSYVEVIREGTDLPHDGHSISSTIDMYWSLTHDGVATFLLYSSYSAGCYSHDDDRIPYAHLT